MLLKKIKMKSSVISGLDNWALSKKPTKMCPDGPLAHLSLRWGVSCWCSSTTSSRRRRLRGTRSTSLPDTSAVNPSKGWFFFRFSVFVIRFSVVDSFLVKKIRSLVPFFGWLLVVWWELLRWCFGGAFCSFDSLEMTGLSGSRRLIYSHGLVWFLVFLLLLLLFFFNKKVFYLMLCIASSGGVLSSMELCQLIERVILL